MKNLTFKAAALNDSRPTVNRQSTDGQSQRHCKQTPLSKRWKVLMTLVFLFTFAIGNVWAVDYSPLNYNGGSTLPSGYKYYGSSTGVENKSAFSTTTYQGHTVFDVTAGGTGAYNKRAIEFTVSEDCTLDIEFYVGNDGRILNLFHGNSTVVHSSTGTTKGDNKYTFSYSFEGITSDQTYSLSGSGSKVYISKITFAPAVDCTETAPTSVAVSGGATYDKGDALSNLSAAVTGGTGTMSYQWYRNTTNAATISNELKLANCTTATLAPSNKVGTYYYYCVASNCAGSVTSNTTAVTINADCSATGDIFTLTMNLENAPTSEVKTPASSTMNIDKYINIDGGDIILATGSSQHSSITTTPRIKLGGSSGYAQITLDCPWQEGDIITFEKTNKIALAADAGGTNKIQLASGTNEYTITKEDCLYNQSNLFVLRDGNNVEISSITITRPVYRTITLEYADGVTPDGSIEVIDGEAATKPADPTWEHHRFDGWYAGSDPYNWSETVGGDFTLTAHWTQLYTISFNNGGGSGDAPAAIADKAQSETFEVPANTFTPPTGQVFDHWNDGATDYNPEDTYTVGTSNVILTAVWRTPSTMYGITQGAHENGDFTIDPASQEAGEIVTLEATPDDGYLFGAWEVVKTEDASATGITVDANGQFTMPGYAVTVNATFVADTRKKVLYVTTNAEDATKANDKLYEALKDDYRVTIVGPTSDADQTNYDLVVLHESIGGSNYGATAVAAAKTGNTPVLNTKSYFYNDGRWGWGAPNAGQSVKGATLNSSYCNIADHPLFDGVTMTAGFFEITDDAAAKCMQPVGSFTSGKEGYTLATTPNNGEGNGCAIHELTPAQRGASAGKYLMISVSGDKLNALNANGQKLFQNAAAYLIGSTSWTPIAVPTAAEITGTTAYKTGENIALTASATGTIAAATYAWYKGDTWAEAEAAGTIQAAATAAAGGNTFGVTGCAVGDAGKYWCVISNGTDCDVNISIDVTVAQTYTVNYWPGEGTGATIVDDNATVVADCPGTFTAPTGKMFYGWKDGEDNDVAVGATVTSNLVLYAQWGDIMVAKIGETLYPSLEAALEHAADGEIVLLQDIDVTSQIEILADVTATIDLAGHKIEYTGTSTLPSGVILVHNGASLTIDDSSDPDAGSIVSGEKAYAAIALTKAGDDAANPATLVVNGGTLTGHYYGITGNGSRNNTDITINGGTITGTVGIAIYHPQVGTLTVNNGSLKGEDAAIEMRAGTLVINDGTFTATATVFSCNPNGSGSTTSGAAIAIAQHTTKKDIEVTINGGTFNGVKALNESNPQVNDPAPQVTMAVTAGTFTGEVSTVDVHEFISGGTFDAPIAKEYCAVNYVPKDNGDGTYGVKPKDGVCLIKGNVDDNTFVIDEDASLLNGTPSKNNVKSKSSTYQTLTGWKFNARPAHLGLTLSEGTFQKGDVVEVFVTSVADDQGANDKMRVFTANDVTKMLVEGDADMVQGANRLTLPETTTNALYLVRGSENADYDMWNPYVAYFAVYRPMMPKLTAITINGEACVKGEGNTFSITLPEEGTNLASLEVVPTIIRNAAHATTPEAVVSNEGAWKAGDNTYRVMDKDGDYTDYTITITLQGEAPAPVIATQPAGVAYCAGSEPTLTVDATGNELHYAWFKEAGVDDEAVGTDAASYTVEAAGTYYVIVTNHVDGKLDKSVTSENAIVTLNTAAAITTQPTNKRDIALNSEVTLSVEATNATGYQWYICDDAEKHNASAISGAEAANYVFNCTANAYYYCVVGNACGEDLTSNVVSVKLEPEGCNTIASIPDAEPYQYEQTGEWTLYGIDSNGRLNSSSKFVNNAKDFNDNTVNAIADQRVGIIFEKDVESLTLYATSSSTGRTWKSDQQIRVTSDEITSGSPVYTNVTATREVSTMPGNTKQYIFTANDMIIPAGKKAWLPFSGNINIFKICYSTALAEPVLPTLSDQELCAGAAYETFDATITNAAACEGTVSYKWYETTDTENPVAETATFTPSAEGTYYVVVTHAATGHITRTVQSDNLTVAHFDALTLVSNSGDVFQHMGTEATLSVVATGKNVAYVWYTCDVDGNNAEVISGASTASYVIASIAEGVQYYKVVISHDCDATTLSHVFKVEGWNQLEQVDVTASTVWDMNNVSASEINLASFEPTKQNVLLLLANIEGVNNNASFNSQALMFEGQRIGRTENNVKYVSGQYVQFNVTVPGMVSVTFASNGSAQRTILINGKQCSRTTNDGTYIKYDVAVEPGSVEIEDVQGYVRISKIEFKAEYSHNRPGLNPANIGTLCWTNNAILGGATLYELAGKNENNKLVFDEVAENRLEAGKPYIFVPENGNTEIKLYNTDTEDALTQGDLQAVNGMHGTFVNLSSADGDLLGNYVISKNHYIYVDSDNVTLKAYRAYITSLDDVEPVNNEPAPINGAPRRRIVMGAQGEQVATGIDNLEASEKPLKLMIDGQMYILRGEKLFDATGRLVK